MAAQQVQNEKLKGKSKSSRRRKKRRTEDFSSDSSSDDSSSSEDEKTPIEPLPTLQQNDINIDDIDIESDDEQSKKIAPKPLSNETIKNLNKVPLTTTPLSSITGLGKSLHSINNTNQIKSTIDQDKQQLQNEYLGLMAGEFGNDLDELRKKPDFTDKSLVILAKALQSGANMFDKETLNSILNK